MDIDPQRMERMKDLLDNVVIVDEADIDYYMRYKKKSQPPKMKIHQRKRGPKPKDLDESAEDDEISFIDKSLLEQGMAMGIKTDMDPRAMIFDRRLEEFEAELSQIESPVSL